MDAATDNAGVRFPPPALYLSALLGGYFLNAAFPLPIAAGRISFYLAMLLCGLSVALMAGGVGVFRRAGTSVVPVRPSNALVITGPYRFTRNPMYVGMAGLTAGLSRALDTWWPVLLLVPVLIIVRYAVIAREERYLLRRFGGEYEDYLRRVRRWI